jgi:hypothetical protein
MDRRKADQTADALNKRLQKLRRALKDTPGDATAAKQAKRVFDDMHETFDTLKHLIHPQKEAA